MIRLEYTFVRIVINKFIKLIMTNKEIPRDPSKEEIKFILELIEINKIYDAEKNLNKITKILGIIFLN